MRKIQLYRPCRALIEPHKKAFDIAPFPMCFTERALQHIALTIGSYVPETGGKLFGPTDTMGIDRFELDKVGSSQAGRAIYAPDVNWGSQRVEANLNAEQPRFWWGDIHSHPGRYNRPSPEVGDGLGDLGYAAKVFETNEALLWYFMPIVTLAPNCVHISPFLIRRDRPHHPFIAPEIVRSDAKDFPEAKFNPDFLMRIETTTTATVSIKPIRSSISRRRYWNRTYDRRAAFGL